MGAFIRLIIATAGAIAWLISAGIDGATVGVAMGWWFAVMLTKWPQNGHNW